jgi:2-polyprenyl-3-methyl-5-hydroxy-6-metoxy-1,4-benzoquinol methylase
LAEAPAVIDHDNLEEFTDPENYDRECGAIGEEGAFFLDLVRRSGGPVLDIGCGTGRLAIPLAHEGFAVTGVDLSENMLAQARTKSADLAVDWVRGDMREMALARRYRSAFMAGHAFQAMLTDGEQRALFDGVARHLEPGGLFAFAGSMSRRPRSMTLTVPSCTSQAGAVCTAVTTSRRASRESPCGTPRPRIWRTGLPPRVSWSIRSSAIGTVRRLARIAPKS